MRTSFIGEQKEVAAYAEVSVPLDLMLLCGGTSFALFLWGTYVLVLCPLLA